MAGAYPLTPALQSGFTHSLLIRADVKRFRSGKEQRYAISGLLNSFRLAYQDLSWTELAALRDFFVTQKGAFDSTWSLTVKSPITGTDHAYANLAFDTDEFPYTEPSQGHYSLTLPVVQTVGEAVTVSLTADFPALATGALVQFPWSESLLFSTIRNDLDCGKRYAWANWANPLRTWKLEYSNITDAELATLAGLYVGQGGPVNTFDFADPEDATEYTGCRFSQEPFIVTRVCPGINKASFQIEQSLI